MPGFEKYKGERKNRKALKKEKKKAKKHKPLSLIVKLVIALVLAMVLLFAIVFTRLNFIDSDEQTRIDRESEWFETSESMDSGDTISSRDINWYKSGETISDKAVTNILLIGQDRRKGEGRTRSDVMMIMSINRATNDITLVSLMRDMYVQIPGYSNNKMNAAYAFGGMELIDETITRNFGIIIDGNIEVDFDGFKDVINQLGGVDIEMTEDEAVMMNEHDFDTVFKAGKNHMNSEEALVFVRNRSMGGYDYNRTERQRKLIMAVYDMFRNQEISKSVALTNTLLNYVTTDINPVDAVKYGISVINNLSVSSISSERIPVDGTFYDANVDGMAVLVPDLRWNRIYLKNYLYGTPLIDTESDKLKILRALYAANPDIYEKNGAYMKCSIEMKAYGII